MASKHPPRAQRVDRLSHNAPVDELVAQFAGPCRGGQLTLDFTESHYWRVDDYARLFTAVRTHSLRSLRWIGTRFEYATQEADDNMRDMMDYHWVHHDEDVLGSLLAAAEQVGLPDGLMRFGVLDGCWSEALARQWCGLLPAGLQHVEVTGAQGSELALAALAKCALPQLTKLQVGGPGSGDALATALAALPQSAQLVHLEIEAPRLTASGIATLRDAPGLGGRTELRVVPGRGVPAPMQELLAAAFPGTVEDEGT